MNLALDGLRMESRPMIRYALCTSSAQSEPEWDDFLARTPGGHHVQTSLWAQVKGAQGWRALRIIASRSGQIVGGVQVLLRPFKGLGMVGYAPKGPMVASDDPALASQIIQALRRMAKEQGILYLLVQPPVKGDVVEACLPQEGFHQTGIEIAPTATTRVDLRPDLDSILARMRKKTRYGIRRSTAAGITVRLGSREDLPAFHRLLSATAQRQGFTPFPLSYFIHMWDILHPRGQLQLFLAEYQGEPVSAHVAVTFGDTLLSKQGGWSGEHGKHRPNEALEWGTIQWAKAAGYRYFDMEGIDPAAARAILEGRPLPPALRQTPTSYKLGYGGEVVMFPPAYGYISNSVLRWIYAAAFSGIARSPLMQQALDRLRVR